MQRTQTHPWRLFRRSGSPRVLTTRSRKESGHQAEFERFRDQTFPHLDVIYSDALCLTGNQEDAADLTVEAYFRAFLDYGPFQRQSASHESQTLSTRAWLIHHLHTALCDSILARTAQFSTLIGGRI